MDCFGLRKVALLADVLSSLSFLNFIYGFVEIMLSWLPRFDFSLPYMLGVRTDLLN